MSNRTNVILGAAIVGAIVADVVLTGGAASVFLAKKLADLVEYVAFWR